MRSKSSIELKLRGIWQDPSFYSLTNDTLQNTF